MRFQTGKCSGSLKTFKVVARSRFRIACPAPLSPQRALVSCLRAVNRSNVFLCKETFGSRRVLNGEGLLHFRFDPAPAVFILVIV